MFPPRNGPAEKAGGRAARLTAKPGASTLAALFLPVHRTRVAAHKFPKAQGQGNETHVPARYFKTGTHPRVPCTHGDQSRTPRAEAAARERARPADAVANPSRLSHPFATNTSNHNEGSGKDNGPKRSVPAASGGSFSKQFRLPDKAAFDRVFATANRSRDNLFTVLSSHNGKRYARLGLAISRKHCRLASGRNRLKRLVRESFRHHHAQLAGLDLVVLGQPGAAKADNKTIFCSLERHWQKSRSASRKTEQRAARRQGSEAGAGKPR